MLWHSFQIFYLVLKGVFSLWYVWRHLAFNSLIKRQGTEINCKDIILTPVTFSGLGSKASLEGIHDSRCWQNSAAPQTKWAFPCRYGPLTSVECLKQSQLQKDVGCQIQTQSGPSPKMRSILIILKESRKLLEFAQVKSKPYWVVATL